MVVPAAVPSVIHSSEPLLPSLARNRVRLESRAKKDQG